MPEMGFDASGRPPYSNRGVYPLNGVSMPNGVRVEFDAYCSTVYAHQDLIIQSLVSALADHGESVTVSDGPKVAYYSGNTLLLDEHGHRIASVRHGGANHHPFVECKGRMSPLVADVLREGFGHRPSRLDSSCDLSGASVMREMDALAVQFEEKFGVRRNYAGAALDNPDRGTTIYLGSRKSMVFVRVYQKGLQVAEQQGLIGDAIPDKLRNWVRIELEFKPDKKRAKEAARRLSPVDCWGVSPWTAEFCKAALSIEAERVTVTERRESDHDRALRFMAHQYRTHLDKLIRDCRGDKAAAMDVLLDYADIYAVPAT